MAFLTDIRRICTVIFGERRLPGRCYQLYFSFLDRIGIRFATIKSSNGLSVRGYTHCLFMFYETWSKHDYDIPGFTLTKDMTVIDLGANQGFFSLYAASKGARVYAFEPCTDNFEVLTWNVAKNGLGDQIKLFSAAVTGKTGQIPFFVGVDSAGGILSGSASTCNPNRGGKAVETRSVESVTLDSLLHDLNIEKCDFLKMDCEGAEYEILRNTSQASFRKIARISMECHSNRICEASTMLKEAGFDIVFQSPAETGLLKATNTQVCR